MSRSAPTRARRSVAVRLLAAGALTTALVGWARAGAPAAEPPPAGGQPPPVAAAPPAAAVSLAGRIVREVDVEAPPEAFRSDAERRYLVGLLGVPVGRPLERAALRRGIERVYRTGKWRGVSVEGTPAGGDGVALRLVLDPVERVGILRFEGPRIVTRRELENVVQLRAGQEYRPESIARATRAAQDYLDRLGYPDAVVVATSRPFGEPFEREVTLSLTPNEPCRLTAVTLMGDLGPGEAPLRAALRVEVGGTCNRAAIDGGIDRIRRLLREDNRFEAVVDQPRLDYGPERRTAALTVQVRAGPRTELVFELVAAPGATPQRIVCRRSWRLTRALSASCREFGRLRDALQLGDQPDFSEEGLSQFIDRLVAYYREQGHAWASVGVRTEPLPEGRRLVFRIDPGPKMTIRGVEFKGNARIDRRKLLDQMVTRPRSGLGGILASGVFLQGEFEQDLDAIRTFYRQQGFLDVRMADVDFRYSPGRDRMWITITIDEGRRYYLTGVDVEGADAVPADVLRRDLPIRTGQPFSLAAVDRAVEWLVQAHAARGYLSARVVPDVSLEPDPPSARARLTVTAGPKTTVGYIIYRGNFYTRTGVLGREMTVKSGEPYDPSAVLESQRNIGRVGFLRNVTVRPADEAAGVGVVPVPVPAPSPSPGAAPSPAPGATPAPTPMGPVSRDLLVAVEEANRVDLSFGFDYSLEERLRVFGDVTHRNLFGTDRSLSLRGLAGDKESLYGLEYRQPYLFGVRLDGRIAPAYQDRREVNFAFRRSSVVTSVQRDLTRTVRVSFGYEFEDTKTRDVKPGTILDPRDVGSVQIGSLRPIVVWDTRDDPFNPTRGFLNTLNVEAANQALLSEAEFVRVVAGSSWFFPLERTRRFVLGVSARGGYGVPYGVSREVPLIRRFFLGGSTTVRGFERDEISPKGADGAPTGGNVYVNENVELRAPLPFGFGGALFFDAGQVWLDESDVDVLDQRSAYGVGLRYVTPIGPIRLDYGRKVDREPGESAGEIHFSIGYVF